MEILVGAVSAIGITNVLVLLLLLGFGFCGKFLLDTLTRKDELIVGIVEDFKVSLKDISEELKEVKITLAEKNKNN